ncbi:MAG: DUF2344 domain-containing protein [Myxococcota bacterium]
MKSIAEVADVFLVEDMSADDVRERIEAVTDPGLHIIGAVRVELHAPPIAKIAKVAEYIHGPRLHPPTRWRPRSRAPRPASLLVDVERKHGLKTIDVRDGLIALQPSTCRPPRRQALSTCRAGSPSCAGASTS